MRTSHHQVLRATLATLGAIFAIGVVPACISVEGGSPTMPELDGGSDVGTVTDAKGASDLGNAPDAACVVKKTETKAAAVGTQLSFGPQWSNPELCATIDGQSATLQLSTVVAEAAVLNMTKLGFQIPAQAKILGVEVKIARRSTAASIKDSIVKLTAGGALVGDNKLASQPWSDAFTDTTYGGKNDVWGASLSPAIVNQDAFGLSLLAVYAASTGSGVASVDGVSMVVHYCE